MERCEMRIGVLIIGCIFLPIFSCPAAEIGDRKTEKTEEPVFGNAVVEKVLSVEQVYRFRCDIKDWPAIIGQNIPVQIAGVTVPVGVNEEDRSDTFFQTQTRRFLEGILGKAKNIRLENIKRGQGFCLVADVIADSNSVASILIENGFAEKADGRKYTEKFPAKAGDTGENTSGSVKPVKAGDPQVSADRIKATPKTPARETVNSGYVASKSSKVFHYTTCNHAKRIAEKNTIHFARREEAIATGRQPCKTCSP